MITCAHLRNGEPLLVSHRPPLSQQTFSRCVEHQVACTSPQLNALVRTKQANLQARRGKRLELAAILQDASTDAVKSESLKAPLVKICGVTNVKDAIMAAQAGARYVGMILWQKSKRSISIETAKAIAYAVRIHKAEPVGVFVDEDADMIERCCNLASIGIAQLHGEGARLSLTKLPSDLKTIYVLHVDKNGVIQTALPATDQVDWILLDSLQGGSGHTFDWEKLKALSFNSKSGWLLAGGLNPENVATAISTLKPSAVDVSSGVTMPDGLLKDPARVSAFMNAVKSCTFT